MGKYFNNEILDGLWVRLVNITEKLSGNGGWTGTGPIYEEDGYMTISNPSADEFVFPRDSINWDSQLGALPIATTQLDKNVVYAVTDTRLSIIGYIEYKGGLSNTGVEGIHEALLSYTNLERNTSPIKLADYMKGIATCARYVANGYTDYTSENTLAEIIEMLEEKNEDDDMSISVTLDNTGVATVTYIGFTPSSPQEIYWTLYDGDGNYLVYDGIYPNDSIYTHDFSSYMTNGGLYKVEVLAYHQGTDSYLKGSSEYVEYLGGNEPTEYISATLTTETFDDDIEFHLDFSYSASDLYIEGALATLTNADGETIVSGWQVPLNGINPDVASCWFFAQDICDRYVKDASYTLKVTIYETIPDNQIWDTTSITFTWPFDTIGGDEPSGPSDEYPHTCSSCGHTIESELDEDYHNISSPSCGYGCENTCGYWSGTNYYCYNCGQWTAWGS